MKKNFFLLGVTVILVGFLAGSLVGCGESSEEKETMKREKSLDAFGKLPTTKVKPSEIPF